MGRVLALAGVFVLATSLLTIGGAVAPAAAAPLLQCNGVGGGGGQGYDCSVTITNTFDVSTGIGSSTVRTIACNGPANTDPLPTCIDSGIVSFAELTPTVEQCNGTIGGNGGSLYCSVSMTNTITGDPTVSAATVNQCVGSLGGGGTVTGSGCDPIQSTTGATVDQCNGSVNGGGGYMVCTVGSESTANSAFDVYINQCNGSAEGTGNLMECDVQITTLVLPADTGGDGGDGGTGGSGGEATADGTDTLAATGPAPVHAALGGLALVLLLAGAGLLRVRQPVEARRQQG